MRRSTRIGSASATLAARTEVAASSLGTETTKRRSALSGKRALSVSAALEEAPDKKIKVEFHETVKAETLPDASPTLVELGHDGGDWNDLCSAQELSCVVTLTSGQVFSWKRYADSDAWIGVVGQQVYKLRQRSQRVQYQLLHPPDLPIEQAYSVLFDYFRLEVEAVPLYKKWIEKDDDMSKIIESLPGLRIVRQDPVECLFAFICSSNNNIQRITQMITKLKATYGQLLYHDQTTNEKFFAFPSVETLASQAQEQTLRDLGFGYRAPFIVKSSQLLQSVGGREYLMELRKVPASGDDDEYAAKLMEFAGVGRKVADCIGLFSLNKLHAIPVDTHVWQIACREFDPSLKNKKSLTPSVYQAVGDHFRARFSPLAGWAHSVLFTGDLKSFLDHLPEDVQKRRKKPSKSDVVAIKHERPREAASVRDEKTKNRRRRP